jgi:prophage regulatory protein
MHTEVSGPRILRMPDVEVRVGLSRQEIYRRARLGIFPKPVALGPATSGWLESEVSAWIAARVQDRDEGREPIDTRHERFDHAKRAAADAAKKARREGVR